MNIFKRLLGNSGLFVISVNLFKLPIIGKKIEIFFAGGENAEQTKPKKNYRKNTRKFLNKWELF